MQSDANFSPEENLTSPVNVEAHTPQEIEAANYARSHALEYYKKSNFGRALAHLFVALRLLPEWRDELRNVFCQALNGGCKQLADSGRKSDTLSLKKDALLIYPNDETLLMDLGSSYYQLNDIEQAIQYYNRALEASPSFLPASRAIQLIYNKEVERWHFRMLNDFNRNKAYHCAISHRIQEGYSSVLDVGTGTGILSLYAVESGAAHIWACEASPFMFKTAKSVLAANNASAKINLINKHSQHLSVPTDIPQKVSMLVTEVFDAGLLGEGILPLLLHAWQNLLLPPSSSLSAIKESGIVIPYSATIWVAAVQSIDIARRHRLLPSICSCFKGENFIDSGPFENLFIPFGGNRHCKFCEAPCEIQLDSGDLVYHLDGTFVAVDSSEPYTTEDLENIPFGFEFLSKPHEALEINFNSIEELYEYGCKNFKEVTLPLLIDSAGSVDAIVSWFHLNLDNNGTIISTAPYCENGFYRGVCWHQAVFPSFLPKRVSPGDEIPLKVETWGDALKISEIGVDYWSQKVKDSNILLPRSECIPFSVPCLFVSDHIVAFLNNRTWMKALNSTALELVQHFSHVTPSTKRIMDMSPFPILGLQMLKASDPCWKLIAKAESKVDEEYIKSVARKNNIQLDQIDFTTEKNLIDRIEHEIFDVISVNVVDNRGEIEENVTNILPILLSRISPIGIIVPCSISVECQLIESVKLNEFSQVLTDESMGNYKIKDFMNTFAVDYHLDIASQGLKFKTLSDVFETFKFSIDSLGTNSICCDQKQDFSIISNESGTVSGVLYWFNVMLLAGSSPVSTLCYDSHCNQAAMLSNLNVDTGMKLVLKCLLMDGVLDMKLSKEGV